MVAIPGLWAPPQASLVVSKRPGPGRRQEMNAPLTTGPLSSAGHCPLLCRVETRAGKAVKAAGRDALVGSLSHAPAPSLSRSS